MTDKAKSAELILKLYDLRREAVMREARNWFFTFTPESVEHIQQTAMGEHARRTAAVVALTCHVEGRALAHLRGLGALERAGEQARAGSVAQAGRERTCSDAGVGLTVGRALLGELAAGEHSPPLWAHTSS